ncbi:MAG: peptidylprolyl isomerase [Clostridiales bacterium]|nr:peptidylprolyl isomerase [Clostridiales bacterium]
MSHPEGTTVRVHYTGRLDDGSVFDSSLGHAPLEFAIGAGQVIPGFESAVIDLKVGDIATVSIAPEDAYGPRMPDATQAVPVTSFTEEPYLGAMVQLVGPAGERIAATITEIDQEEALLDFNHPLAGRTLTFEIELVELVTE